MPVRSADLPGLGRSAASTSLVLVPCLALAFWPVWRWYTARMTDGSDEPLGWIALVMAGLFVPRQGWRNVVASAGLWIAAAATMIYAAGFAFLPPLVRAALAMLALACVLPRDRTRALLPLLALLLLSLPVIATLQYFLGFPLRAFTSWCAAHLLDLAGYGVTSRGTVLHWAGEQVLVDAPCSGIRMLWTSAFLSATLAAAFRLPAKRFLRLLQATASLVFVANLLRTLLLFFLETGLWPNPAWAHETAGLAVFFAAAAGCVAAANRLRVSTAAA